MRKKRSERKPVTTLTWRQLKELDLDQFFVDAVRDRSLFALLDSLQNACCSRADHCEKELTNELHPSVKPMYEDEAEFFRDAEAAILDVRMSLESDWQGREMPSCADGHFPFHSARATEAVENYMVGLLTKLNEPSTPADQWRDAAITVSKELDGTIWFEAETGKPDFKMFEIMSGKGRALLNPDVSTADKLLHAAELQEFFEWQIQKRAKRLATA